MSTEDGRVLRVAVITSAFPRGTDSGVDVVLARRAQELTRHAGVVAVVPTPWAPWPLGVLRPEWAAYARTPRHANVVGLRVFYPRYLQMPGGWFAPWAGIAMALGARRLVRRLRRAGECDVLYAQSVLPDGLAAVLLGRWTGLPAACLGRGSDVNVTSRATATGRRLAAWTLRRAAAVGAVAHDLAGTIAVLAGGRSPTVLYNGIDLEHFVPGDRDTARHALGVAADVPLVLFVGRLVPGKGLGDLIDAMSAVGDERPAARLVLVGDGPLAPGLRARAAARGTAGRIDLVGEASLAQVVQWMQAADVVALPSEAEGFPNVVREAFACGRPVVATPVGDVPRVVGEETGVLVPVGDPQGLAAGLLRALGTTWDPTRIRSRVADMTWEENAAATYRFLSAAVGARA